RWGRAARGRASVAYALWWRMGAVDRADGIARVDQLLDLDPGRVAVVLVDFQRDFCGPPGVEAGRSGTDANARTALRANAFAAEAARLGIRVIYSQQVLEMDRLTWRQRRWEIGSRLCMAGSGGAELFVPPVPGARVVRKHRFDIWHSQEFLDVLA